MASLVPAAASPSFDEDVANAVLHVKSALAGVFAELSKPIRGGTDLQRELGLPSTLCWQLHGVVIATDPLPAAALIPGRQAVRRLLLAAGAYGVSNATIERATRAFREFEACVTRHTGSRAAFASMVSALPDTDSSAADLKARRDAFRASTHIYGIHLSAVVNTFIMHPSRTPGRYDFVFIAGWIGLQVVRPFEKLLVGRHRSDPDDPAANAALIHPKPIETPPGFEGIPVLTGFSSHPLPTFTSEPGTGNQRELYISGPPVGRTGELTFILADLWEGAVPSAEPLNCDGNTMNPAREMIHDVLLAPSVAAGVRPPRTAVYGGALHELRRQYREVDRLNVHAQSAFVGTGVESLHTPVFPRYVQMLRYVCDRLGWNADDFSAYRCQIDHPVLHALVNVAFLPSGQPEE